MAAYSPAFWVRFSFLLACVEGSAGTLSSVSDKFLNSAASSTDGCPGPSHLSASVVSSTIGNLCGLVTDRHFGVWDVLLFSTACGLLQAYRIWKRRDIEHRKLRPISSSEHSISNNSGSPRSGLYSVVSDPGLLRKHSTFKTYATSIATYTSVRVFYRPHPQADKLPNQPPLPLIVFIHGLGGSLAQFHPLMTSLVNVAPTLGIDLPGCGLSAYSSRLPWKAYSVIALSELLNVIVERYCDYHTGQGVILIGHSMGCSLSTMLASTASPLHAHIKFKVLGLIAICPKASLSSQEQVIRFRRFLHVPTLIFDLWRKWDRRGGPNSASVTRFVPENADIETKKLQQKFNESSRTAVWRRMAWGALPDFDANGEMVGGLPGPDIWAGLSLALLLVAGEADNVTKPEEIALICKAVRRTGKENEADYSTLQPEEAIPQATAPLWKSSPQVDKAASSHDDKYGLEKSTTKICETGGDSAITSMDSYAVPMLKHKPIVKATILPSPATHALLYDHATYRTLAGLIQTFLCDHIDSRLSLGWQLQYLCTEGKWDVKNLAKWQAVTPVSEPIAGVFRAMKTLREIDGVHSPAVFVKDWKDKIKAVVDISHESPVYDSQGLESGGIEYHKFPTVSKIPPTTDEVKDFITLVDRLRLSSQATDHVRLIGVHCHYGYNRTGFFICAYLIEKEGFSVQGAIDAFQKGRPPGIRHEHFIDTLFVRYCMGLKRDPTI